MMHPPLRGLGFTSRQKFLVLINGKLYLNCKLKGEGQNDHCVSSFRRPTDEELLMAAIRMWVTRVKTELHPYY